MLHGFFGCVIMQEKEYKTTEARRKSIARYKAEKTVSIQAFLPPEYKDKLNKLAESAGVSKAQILKNAIDTLYSAAFDEQQPAEQE